MALLFSLLAVAAPPPIPNIPSQYKVDVVYSIPYFNITEPFTTVYDSENNRQYWNFYNGLDVFIFDYANNIAYEEVPKVYERDCQVFPPEYTLFPQLTTVFPNFTLPWVYQGISEVSDVPCFHWQLNQTFFNKTQMYHYYQDVSFGRPVRLEMFGVDFIFGSHPDHYIYEYVEVIDNYQNDSLFVPPSQGCHNMTTASSDRNQIGARTFLGAKILENNVNNIEEQYPHDMFLEFVKQFEKQYRDEEEKQKRLRIWRKNMALIDRHNQAGHSYQLRMNHFGDLEDEEFLAVIMPHVDRPSTLPATLTHVADIEGSDLPSSVDWRTKGAVTMVKDQGACGSCWSFGSTGSLEGVWYLKTGKLISLSEQQLVDCAWTAGPINYSNQGCNGGFAAQAYQWYMDNGMVATEEEYPYLAQDGYCRRVNDSGVVVTGYVNVTSGDEHALKDAVAKVGPVAVAIDAAHPEFRFYSSGVYYNSDCKNGVNDLDHEVLVVGYGSSQDQDYWIVKNSWSTYWGNEGYVNMARNRDNNCGIATQPNYPLV